MKKRSWTSITLAGFLAVALLAVLNPEVRALILLIDFLGLDMILLLFATQARSTFTMFDPLVAATAERACKAGSAVSGQAI